MATYAVSIEQDELPWWLVLIDGIALFALGVLLLIAPAQTTLVTVQFIGLYWLIGGILKIVSLFMNRTAWGWKLFAGLLGIFAGLAVLQHPLWSPLVIGSTIIIILGIQGILYGAVGLLQAFRGGGWASGILGGISILFGLILLFDVWVAAFSLPWIIGVVAIVGGGASIFNALRIRQAHNREG